MRIVLTSLGVALTVVGYVLLATVVSSWDNNVKGRVHDRLGTRARTSFIVHLPQKYVERLALVPHVQAVTWANWYGGKDAKTGKPVAALAVDHRTYLEVYDEIALDAEDRRAWSAEPSGAVIGAEVAKSLGLKRGDHFTLTGGLYPGEWEVVVVGVYGAARPSADLSQILLRWDSWNRRAPAEKSPWKQHEVGWIVSRLDDQSHAAETSRAIDAEFASAEVPTLTMHEDSLRASFLGVVATVLGLVSLLSVTMLAVMALLLGNTIFMSARERTVEGAVLRAIGFSPRTLVVLATAEGAALGALGGAFGVALAWVAATQIVGPGLQQALGNFFPSFVPEGTTLLRAFVAAVVAGALPSLWASWRGAALPVTHGLRHTG